MTFFHKCNIPLASHRDLQPYPASAKSLAILYRIVAASGSLPQQNFDFGRRSCTPPCAQNDKQRFCFTIRVRKKRAIRESPIRTNENKRVFKILFFVSAFLKGCRGNCNISLAKYFRSNGTLRCFSREKSSPCILHNKNQTLNIISPYVGTGQRSEAVRISISSTAVRRSFITGITFSA